ncbi:integrase arm-type DNA-binding domain-containing protein [Novosphingobium sp. FSY-8]|uniref:Integrase arm-type DNA-binding domain-containing protein n=1 Tax=Novosphingobium ovatum TaxID=1908523 RepID=A0ABW9XGS1_9SPHN|nr:site-specific integrase [Novosphingobium ovatum]NBC37745.1 integrase arm-type DNA-binding domain-containing protein [Novosphingobium ovatum]
MPTAPITKRTVDAAKPGSGDIFIWDTKVPGFGLKVTPSGGKVYVFQYRMANPGAARAMPARRMNIGKHGAMTPDQARTRAIELAAIVKLGTDPQQEARDKIAAKAEAKRQAEEKAKLESDLVFEKLAERWLKEYEIDHRATSVGQAKVSVRKYLTPKLAGKPMPHITKADLQAALDAIPTKQKATRQQVFAYASILWRWALERGDIADNPVPSMAKPKVPKARDRVLTDDELATVWKAAKVLREPLGAFYRLLILTGQRREEVAGMTWAQVDRATATWVIPADKAKNAVAHIVPLSPAVMEELDRLALDRHVAAKTPDPDAKRWPKAGPVISIKGTAPLSCFSQARKALDAEVLKVRGAAGELEAWRVHDLRRTLATGLQRLGVRFEVTEAVLNHVSGARSGVAGIYQRHDWADEKRSALEAWARHVAAILTPAEAEAGKVVAITSAKQSA